MNSLSRRLSALCFRDHVCVAWLSVLLVGLASCAHGQVVRDGPVRIEDVGRFDFKADGVPEATQLSGITYAGEGETYYAVSDKAPLLFKLAIRLNTGGDGMLGMVESVHVVADERFPLKLTADARGTPFAQGPDREGCAYDPASRSVWISDEGANPTTHPPQFRRHSLADGTTNAGPVTATSEPGLAVFGGANTRGNLSFESLTRIPDGSGYWSANEEALGCDGDRSSISRGSVVRLVRFDKDFKAVAQYAYETESVPNPAAGPRLDHSGVADLCALPDGSLLVLERAASFGGWRSRIFLADVSGATDVSKGSYARGLKNRPPYAAAKKTLLFDKTNMLISVSNYEGLCLGPKLPDGSYALLMIADNNGAALNSVYAMRVYGAGK